MIFNRKNYKKCNKTCSNSFDISEKAGWYYPQEIYDFSKKPSKQVEENKGIPKDDYEKLLKIVDKIVKGNRNWSAEELQLQINYPDIIEKLLKEKSN